jgi:hypothetical protein
VPVPRDASESVREYVCFSQWFYEGNEFTVWQCFWPDVHGRYPWDANCDLETKKLQLLLYLPLDSISRRDLATRTM